MDASIKKVGVFVNATLEELQEKVREFELNAVQLHGNESVDFCKSVKKLNIETYVIRRLH